jgi:hypothetical protein
MSAARGLLRMLRYAWAFPNSAPGALLVLAALASGGRAAVVSGVVEAHGGAVAFMLRRLVPLRGGASAMTLGHVVVGRDRLALERTRAHERAHVRQCERWGILFIPAYLAASLVAWLRGGHYYRDNRFERGAVAAASASAPRG